MAMSQGFGYHLVPSCKWKGMSLVSSHPFSKVSVLVLYVRSQKRMGLVRMCAALNLQGHERQNDYLHHVEEGA